MKIRCVLTLKFNRPKNGYMKISRFRVHIYIRALFSGTCTVTNILFPQHNSKHTVLHVGQHPGPDGVRGRDHGPDGQSGPGCTRGSGHGDQIGRVRPAPGWSAGHDEQDGCPVRSHPA